jgi:hypothetical protein
LRWVVLMEGINDIGHSTSADLPEQGVSADEIIAGMKQIIARVHDHGAKIYGVTLTPYEGTVFHGYHPPEGEAKREAVNAWIRRGGYFDAVIDFDAAVRDPDHPTRIRPDYDVGDHLHPNDAVYRAMGDAVDLKLFELRRAIGAIRDGARRQEAASPARPSRTRQIAHSPASSVSHRSRDEHGRGACAGLGRAGLWLRADVADQVEKQRKRNDCAHCDGHGDHAAIVGQVRAVERRMFADPIHHGLRHQPSPVFPARLASC